MFLVEYREFRPPFEGKLFIFISIALAYIVVTCSAFDDELPAEKHEQFPHEGTLPKDKILLKSVKTLTFHRNKRTTSKRTHSIHQLSCVGGTAGCKLFTPSVVECENIGFNQHKSKLDWRCHADISNRVKFNHVEVICEGYEYPEDDYILLGSCGLEFTLDYVDPADHHHQSYFKHMDEHEKELHQRRTGIPGKKEPSFFSGILETIGAQIYLIVVFGLLAFSLFLLVRCFTGGSRNVGLKKGKKSNTYGPLTSAVLTTKKAC